MNDENMKEEIKIVNSRILHMLNYNEVNSEAFYRDVRTLVELIEYEVDEE